MPVITGLTRREILRTGAAAIVAAGGLRAQPARGTRWALLSDTHISAEPEAEYRGFRPAANLGKAIAAIQERKPDGCLITGDLARMQGTPGDYGQLKRALTKLGGDVPIGFCLGNHDDRGNFLNALRESVAGETQTVRGKLVAVVQRGPVRFVLLDSLIVANETPGFLGKAQRTWLDQYLETSDATPTLLCVHHTLDDGDNSLLDSDRLLRLAAKHPKVKAIFYGHSHAYVYDTYEGVHLVNLPALGYNFSDSHPVGWVDAKFSGEGADLTLHAIGGKLADDGKTHSLAWRG